jgi:hypothetical protein
MAEPEEILAAVEDVLRGVRRRGGAGRRKPGPGRGRAT